MIAAVYARKSTEQNGVSDDEKSITRQVERARAYAGQKGWAVADEHVYVDDGISGAEFESRPAFGRLMDTLRATPRAFDALVMAEESRLGREQIETAYALKRILKAGVRLFYYLEDRERTVDGPTDKLLMSVMAFTDEMERERARQRTYDALRRKAERRHVTGGRVFGYDNQAVAGEDGRRHHVERVVNNDEAAVVRRIFEFAAEGRGLRAIAHQLNAEQASAPLPRRARRPRGWAPSSVREVLHRELYRGVIVWNRTQKRDQWGQKHQRQRDAEEWLRLEAPELRILPEELWAAAHARLDGTRQAYLRGTAGRLWGRPANGIESKYLLTGLAHCGVCGGSLEVRSRSHGRRRRFFYGCTTYHRRGPSICANKLELPLDDVDASLLDAIEADVLAPDVVTAAVAEALEELRRPQPADPAQAAAAAGELRDVEEQMAHLTEAVKLGGPLATLVGELKALEARRMALQQALRPAVAAPATTADTLRRMLEDWRGMVRRNVTLGRQVFRTLLSERITFTPRVDGELRTCEVRAVCSLGKVFAGLLIPQTMVAPTGFEPVFQP